MCSTCPLLLAARPAAREMIETITNFEAMTTNRSSLVRRRAPDQRGQIEAASAIGMNRATT